MRQAVSILIWVKSLDKRKIIANSIINLTFVKKIKDMELLTTYSSTAATEAQPTVDSYEMQYEQERGKPMPSKNHSLLQAETLFELKLQYGNQFDVFPELSLELVSGKATPDLCIYEKTPRNWKVDVIRTKQPPLLAIEILSPKQNFNDIVEKIEDIYFPAGMTSVWVILPLIQSIMIFKPNEKTKMFNEGVLHDNTSHFDLDLDKVFN